MNRGRMNVLMIGNSEQGWSHLARHLEEMGCDCWFASTTEEIGAILGQHTFRLVLSARPVTEQSPLMNLLKGQGRSVFYFFAVEDSCLWLQAAAEVGHGVPQPALRPSEFRRVLDELVADSWTGRGLLPAREETNQNIAWKAARASSQQSG